MRNIGRAALAAAAIVAAGSPAAAQEPQWVQQLEDQIERQAEAIARAIEAQISGRQNRPPARDRRAETTEAFSRTVRLGRNGTFDLGNVAGDIVINGTGGDDVRIEAVKRVRNSSDAGARAVLQDVQIQVVERAGSVEVRTEYPRRRNTSTAVDYTVAVPNRANVTLRTVSGTVRVNNIRGELRVESVSGDVTASAVERVRELRSISGTLSITDGEGSDVEATTVSGDVTVRNMKARALDLKSVSGNMRFTDVESERANVRSVSGNVEYAGPLTRSGRYDFQSHSGNLRVMPAGDTGFDVEANTFSGSVRSDYALKVQEITGLGFRRGLNRQLRGTFGEAGAALVLQSFSGDITIVKR